MKIIIKDFFNFCFVKLTLHTIIDVDDRISYNVSYSFVHILFEDGSDTEETMSFRQFFYYYYSKLSKIEFNTIVDLFKSQDKSNLHFAIELLYTGNILSLTNDEWENLVINYGYRIPKLNHIYSCYCRIIDDILRGHDV